ncbi:hypothetical protein ABID47_004207 [Paenibacillus favisporus]|uniref:Uncharacterized protein n=1 Tax=Paenibacillus favisporus TaxID=221028 RepID=A0ABV2F748_9BACL
MRAPFVFFSLSFIVRVRHAPLHLDVKEDRHVDFEVPVKKCRDLDTLYGMPIFFIHPGPGCRL